MRSLGEEPRMDRKSGGGALDGWGVWGGGQMDGKSRGRSPRWIGDQERALDGWGVHGEEL